MQPGVEFASLQIPAGPWRVFIVRLDRQQPGWEIRSVLGGGNEIGLATVPAQARAAATPEWKPLAAVNGGYFREAHGLERGTLSGLLILDGELICRPANTSFWVDQTNGLHIAVVQSKMEITWPDGSVSPLGLNEPAATNRPALITPRFGKSLLLKEGLAVELVGPEGSTWPALRPGSNYTASTGRVLEPGALAVPRAGGLLLLHPAQTARLASLAAGTKLRFDTKFSHDLSGARAGAGAGPTFLSGGRTNDWLLRPSSRPPRNPRTAIGFNARYCYLVAVDGRSLSSAGMDYLEMIALMTHLGCTDAMNLDGGTSTTMWVNGKVVNSPSGWLTPAVASALVVLRKEP